MIYDRPRDTGHPPEEEAEGEKEREIHPDSGRIPYVRARAFVFQSGDR